MRLFPLYLRGSRVTDHLSVARELLRHLLTAGPQKGARLKVLLAREFERRAGLTFQQAFWNFPKFSAFLAANADLVEVSAPTGPGDLSVSLRSQPVADHAQALAAVSSPGRFLPPALWNAFTNPDPRRHRFFNRVSGEIVHYLEASQEPPNPNIAARVAADPNYVEITPASAEQQSAWLKEFLSSVPVPESKRALLSNQAVNVTYNDQGGASGSTGAVGIGAAPTVGRCWQLPLASGDTGLQAITNVTGSVASAGTFNVMVLRPLARVYIPVASQVLVYNFTDLGLPELFNDSAIYALYMAPAGTSSGTPWANIQLVNG